MRIIAPIEDGEPGAVYEYDVALGGRSYHVRLWWHDRTETWRARVWDDSGTYDATDLIEPYHPVGLARPGRAPAGGLLVPIPRDGRYWDPEWSDLGSDLLLVWMDSDEIPSTEVTWTWTPID